LNRWRESDATRRILKYLREYRGHVLWWDQDGLNAVLHSSWSPLHAKWNVMASHFDDSLGFEDSILDRATFDGVRSDPGIVHFSSESKPWMPNYAGPFADFWLQAYEPVARFFTHRRDPSRCNTNPQIHSHSLVTSP
jgi:lipopolysaccharide biosynthesis glycosyltransferase